ncbi:ROK family protein [Streptomyces sp. NPDC057020]|uniref:ROK family protein n=1 Tax=unclassified Streptomyces TaxID=2593676 RepID=UPI0036365654
MMHHTTPPPGTPAPSRATARTIAADARPAASGEVLLGVDIGGTKTVVAVLHGDGSVLARSQATTPAARGARAVVDRVVELAVRALAEKSVAGRRPAAIGVGTAGVVAPDGRSIAFATEALPGWSGTPLASLLEAALGAPTVLSGDVQAFLAGELAHGAARGARSAVAVMAGTGIGGAVAVDGTVLRGSHGAAGHLGHLPVPAAAGHSCPCGATGHVEAVASGPAMTASMPPRPAPVTDLRGVAAAAAEGDDAARQILRDGGRALGSALAGVVNMLDPDVVVLAGGVFDSGPWYEEGLRAELALQTLPLLREVPLLRSSLAGDAVLIGAAALTTGPAQFGVGPHPDAPAPTAA